MDCVRCGANELRYFYQGKCRRCIHLREDPVEKEPYAANDARLNLAFELTDYQKSVSDKMCTYVEAGHSVYLKAVCGSGKTEMSLELISRVIGRGLKIAWAIPRRQVVVELGHRLRDYFPGLKVVAVYGGHTDEVDGDLIVCTTHQLYRYPQYFDVLILDEPDAFPYVDNAMLQHIMKRSVRGPIVYLSATLDRVEEDVKYLSLDLRPSQKLLPEPVCSYSFLYLLKCLWYWRNEKVLIFVPTRELARRIAWILRSPYLSSKTPDKEAVIEKFRSQGGFLVCTTVLERGVTFIDCYVIVLYANHRVYSKSSLIQIAGRVGRGLNPSKGEVFFWSRVYTEEVIAACKTIQMHNTAAHSVLKMYEKT